MMYMPLGSSGCLSIWISVIDINFPFGQIISASSIKGWDLFSFGLQSLIVF